MRKLRYGRFFILGFVLLLGLQLAVLTYAEKVYFAGGGRYSSKRVDGDKAVKLKRNLSLDPQAGEIKLSYNGVYMAYTKDGILYSVNLENGKKERIDPAEGEGIVFYQWIYDRNRLVVAERKENAKASAPFKLYYYDTDSNSKEAIYNGVGDKALTLPGHGTDEGITAMDLSTLTNMMYFKLTQENGKSRIYQVNIMAQYERTDTATTKIGAMAAMKSTDDFFYENQSTGRVHEENRGKIQVEGQSKLQLLGVDGEDRVYVGDTGEEDGKVSTIYVLQSPKNSGRKRPKYEKMGQISLETAVASRQIHVTLEGLLCIQDPSVQRVCLYTRRQEQGETQEGKGQEPSLQVWAKSEKEISYEGSELFFYNKGFLSLDQKGQIRNYAW